MKFVVVQMHINYVHKFPDFVTCTVAECRQITALVVLLMQLPKNLTVKVPESRLTLKVLNF